jgi:glycosyltransferase involved in cell wall biosynthesis
VATGLGIDPAQFRARAAALQYVVRAVRSSTPPRPLFVQTLLGCLPACGPIRVLEPDRALGTIPGVSTWATTGGADLSLGDGIPDKVFVWQRVALQGREGVERQRALLRRGYLTVCEIDDDPRLPLLRLDADDFFALRSCHCVQTSTEELADVLRPHNPNVKVFENQLASLPPPRVYEDGGPVAIFFGALNREPDWEALLPALRRLTQAYRGRLCFRVIHDQRFFDALETEQKDYTPFCEYDRYQEILRSCEVALLPLEPTPANRLKSDLKFLECAGYGVAALASPTVYERSLRDGETGLLFHDAAEFEAKLAQLIEDVALRRRLAAAAYAWVKSCRLLAQHYRRRYDWYLEMCGQRPQLEEDLRRRAPELFA